MAPRKPRKSLVDFIRVLYKRRWIAVPAFLLVFGYAAVSTLRQTPIYEATTRLLIERDSAQPQSPARLAAAGQLPDEFDETQYRMMQSRTVAWHTLGALGLNQPPAEPQALAGGDGRLVHGGWLEVVASKLGAPKVIPPPSADETGWQSSRIDAFLAGLSVTPVPNSRLFDLHYRSPDPVFAARAADAAALAYIDSRGSSIQVIDVAEVPRLPIIPNHGRNLVTGLLAGLVLAIGLAFGIDYIDSRVSSPDDIREHLDVPFLGLVPAVKAGQDEGPSPLIGRSAPASFSESIRGLRTAVMFSSTSEDANSVVVTSTAPGEGKTVIASNLAEALAQAGHRTIVIDGDMRRPRVHEMFRLAQEPGLSNVLGGDVALTASIRQTGNPHLHVLPAGLIPPNPAELLGSKRYLDLLEELAGSYDWVVIDAPPVMAVTDATVIAAGASGVVFVVGSEMTPRRNAQIAVEQLLGVRARIAGAVLNRVKVDKHSFYYSQYYREDYTRAYARQP